MELTSTFFTLQSFGPSPSPNFKWVLGPPVYITIIILPCLCEVMERILSRKKTKVTSELNIVLEIIFMKKFPGNKQIHSSNLLLCKKTWKGIIIKSNGIMSLSHKLKFYNHFIFATWWCKPLKFQTWLYDLKDCITLTLGCKDIGIRKSECVSNT